MTSSLGSGYEFLIQNVSNIYQLDENWIKAIITTESNWNPYAIRYESSYLYLYNIEKYTKNGQTTLSTEMAAQKMSWGLGQIMGALAREQGHDGFLSELVKPEVNLKHVGIRLAYLKKVSPEVTDVFSCYNAGIAGIHKSNGKYINQQYVDKAMANLALFQ